MAVRIIRRQLILAVSGIAIGLFALWAAIRGLNWTDMQTLIERAELKFMVLAAFLYGASILLRAIRWRVLLLEIKPVLYSFVAEATTVGFAANYILPARLGELFRIDYLMRLTGVPRTASLGTLAIERLLDGVTVLGVILIGLIVAYVSGTELGSAKRIIFIIGIAGTALFSGLSLFVVLAPRLGRMAEASAWPPAKMLARVLHGTRALNNRTFISVSVLTVAVWAGETLVLWCVLSGFHLRMSFGNLLITVGCATLSTLVPTAPGFLGSYQLTFGLLLSAFGSTNAAGIATATAIQIFCYVPLTVVGLFLAARRSFHLFRIVQPDA